MTLERDLAKPPAHPGLLPEEAECFLTFLSKLKTKSHGNIFPSVSFKTLEGNVVFEEGAGYYYLSKDDVG